MQQGPHVLEENIGTFVKYAPLHLSFLLIMYPTNGIIRRFQGPHLPLEIMTLTADEFPLNSYCALLPLMVCLTSSCSC